MLVVDQMDWSADMTATTEKVEPPQIETISVRSFSTQWEVNR